MLVSSPAGDELLELLTIPVHFQPSTLPSMDQGGQLVLDAVPLEPLLSLLDRKAMDLGMLRTAFLRTFLEELVTSRLSFVLL